MSLIILEGVDRSGKSSVAKFYSDQGYRVIHMSAPDKKFSKDDYVGPSYLDEYVEMLMSFGNENIVLDRSCYGELVWPKIYFRDALLTPEDIEIIREVESSMGVEYILMEDPNAEAHWQRCVDNKEPLNKQQFIAARAMYNTLAKKYGFVKKQLSDFITKEETKSEELNVEKKQNIISDIAPSQIEQPKLTAEQLKLAKANAINTILAKPILKNKGQEYEEIERELRGFLNSKLGLLLGATSEAAPFNKEEIDLIKALCQQLKMKQSQEKLNGRKQ